MGRPEASPRRRIVLSAGAAERSAAGMIDSLRLPAPRAKAQVVEVPGRESPSSTIDTGRVVARSSRAANCDTAMDMPGVGEAGPTTTKAMGLEASGATVSPATWADGRGDAVERGRSSP